jgi:hypothetical protein
MEVVGIIFAVFAGMLAVFQIALALGEPWGAASYGGTNPGVLPTRLRIVSAVFGFGVCPLATLFVLDASGVADTGLADGNHTELWLWVLTGLFGLGTLANFASRSKIERIWGPVTFILAICCGILAVNA